MRSAIAAACAIAIAACASRDWSRFQDPEAGFSVAMPAPPAVTTHQVFPSTTVHAALVEQGSEGSVQVSWYQLLAAARGTDPSLLATVDCAAPFQGNTFASSTRHDITIATLKGIAIEGTAPVSAEHSRGMWEQDRCVVRGDYLFHLIAVGPDTETMRATGQRFLDSFTLEPALAAPTSGTSGS